MSNMPKPIEVELDKPRTMYITLGAMAKFEEHRGKSIDKMDEESLIDVLTFVWVSMLHEDPDLTYEQVGHAIHPGNMEDVFDKIKDAMQQMNVKKADDNTEKSGGGTTKNKKRSIG
ncbi:hypothetical protein [Alkalicoccus chagannorensis]|uniref:hypothetical protein n=1 Tax=Alkalicoccus chagannorensis TaxID=427072 RepID=UPI00047AB614|nr:hypothetical protein [Alkalicoccus chagannorensis]